MSRLTKHRIFFRIVPTADQLEPYQVELGIVCTIAMKQKRPNLSIVSRRDATILDKECY